MTAVSSMRRPVRVMIVDDHDLFRTGLSSLLVSRPEFDVVAQASGGRMAVRLARELRPDVVLMDRSMPDLDGDDATRQILEHDPDARILMLTVANDESSVASAVRAGACGYLFKDSPIDEVYAAVRAAASGSPWLSTRAATALLERIRRLEEQPKPDPAGLDALSPRELEVLRLLARGHENSEIASDLGISPRTAKNHVSSILEKLGLSNRVQAAVYAAKHQLV
jgi:DNA-binding NarL/FixJ family response regulator